MHAARRGPQSARNGPHAPAPPPEGAVPLPLRSPPARPGQLMGEPPAGALPFAFDADFASGNAALRGAARWFEAQGVAGVETVAVAPNGTLALIGERGEVGGRFGGGGEGGSNGGRMPGPACAA